MTATETQDETKKKPGHPPDRTRESIETIVFVVVLVLLLKLFVTEAFVIPTGSMAETLYGYQKVVTCPKCGHEFPVNSHDEVEGQADPNGGPRRPLDMIGAICPNCRYHIDFPIKADGNGANRPESPSNNTGDRVLVLKPIFHVKEPNRGDVVVFKYPRAPQERQIAQNYIKRAMGFGGETLAIYHGDIYVTRSLEYPPDELGPDGNPLYPRPEDTLQLWDTAYMYANNQKALDLFEKSRAAGFPAGIGGFEIARKGIDQLLADRRIVWDNDQQPRDLAGKFPPRWYASPGAEKFWNGDIADQPRVFSHTGTGLDWIRYRHLIPEVLDPLDQRTVHRWWSTPDQLRDVKPQLIDNMLGYNSEIGRYRDTGQTTSRISIQEQEWVGDLILECEATKNDDDAEIVLELSKGLNRFQAVFTNGSVKLLSTGNGAKEYGSRECRVKGKGTYKLRFANVDARLHVWVDDRPIDFGADTDYLPGQTISTEANGSTTENDREAPGSIGAKGGVTIRSSKLHRDIFYNPDSKFIWYVQPGHYMCLGDNSAQSSDSRTWGTVPERLMLGKAVFVFWPFWFDRNKNRIGFIK